MNPIPLTLALALLCSAAQAESQPVPVIHCTDLLHPHDDPDDFFDLACLYAMPGIDLKCVVLDRGELQKTRSGTIPISQLNTITGRQVPAFTGLVEKLKSPGDKALDQPAECQGGVKGILDVLRASQTSVTISCVGSARDLTAAFNREPELFRSRVARLALFAGEASDPTFTEWNVSLDPHAFVGLMRSGLPIYWVPCFDGGVWQNKGHASFWRATHRELLGKAPDPLVQYFVYMLDKATTEPLSFVSSPVNAGSRQRLLAETRNMWGGALLGILLDRGIVREGEQWQLAGAGKPSIDNDVFFFEKISVVTNANGLVTRGDGPDSREVMRFVIRDPQKYPTALTQATARLLEHFPASSGYRKTPESR